MAIQIENARPEDKKVIMKLLQQGDLPTDDLPLNLPDFLIAKEHDTYVGVAGLERFGSVALLRSVAVDSQHQGRQIAANLVEQLLEKAKSAKMHELYLITTTADRYFERYGFKPVDRQQVPTAIQQTQQFTELCPASAIVMKRVVNQGE